MTGTRPLISVVIPSYNDENYLPRALDSVLAQTYDAIEILVIDDASEDDTKSALSKYSGQECVTYVHHLRNLGGSAARNTGIMLAEGEYVAFLDADDTWHPEKLEAQHRYLQQHPEVGAVYCDVNYERAGGLKSVRRFLKSALVEEDASRQHPVGESVIPELLETRFDTHGASTLVVRRSMAERIGGFDPEFQRHQDWEFLVRLLSFSSLGYVNRKLVNKHDTPSPDAETMQEAKRLYFDKFADLIEKYETEGHQIKNAHEFDLGRRFLLQGDLRRGIKYLWDIPWNRRRAVVTAWSAYKGFIRRSDS